MCKVWPDGKNISAKYGSVQDARGLVSSPFVLTSRANYGAFYSQAQTRPCCLYTAGAPTHLPIAHPFCSCRKWHHKLEVSWQVICLWPYYTEHPLLSQSATNWSTCIHVILCLLHWWGPQVPKVRMGSILCTVCCTMATLNNYTCT